MKWLKFAKYFLVPSSINGLILYQIFQGNGGGGDMFFLFLFVLLTFLFLIITVVRNFREGSNLLMSVFGLFCATLLIWQLFQYANKLKTERNIEEPVVTPAPTSD